jgi:hypothetical protein
MVIDLLVSVSIHMVKQDIIANCHRETLIDITASSINKLRTCGESS